MRDTPSQQTRAQSHSHLFLRSLPWSLFCVSHDLCSVFPVISDLFRARIFGRFQVCDRLSFVLLSPHFWLHLSPATGFRQALHHDRTASVGPLLARHTSLLVSSFDNPSRVNICATTAPLRRRHSIEQPLGSFVTVKTQTSSRPSGLYVRMTRGVSITIALNLFSASGTARARSFYMHERTRTTESAVS